MEKKRVLLPVLAFTLLLLVGWGVSSLSAATVRAEHVAKKRLPHVGRRLHGVNPRLSRRLRATAWHWQAVVGRRRAQSRISLASPRGYLYWRRQARRAMRLAAHPPHKSAWLCIHRFEGSWSDLGDPYWGGLQMDRGFMRRYAPGELLRRGWANRWTPLEQMWVAERAYRTRGFYPWPNTARYCGLI
ncbi:MAG: hypothetical protein E6G15_09220 [Actinobacteria bacterium]|nr:MAG: hypothetical protein E6G15_09220 [Actinomycetota bacterium]